MAVELRGYSREINQKSMLKQGLEDLRNTQKEKARDHLLELRRDLETKSGVVRLLHTTKTDKDMKFKNAGAFKRMFLSGEKLKRSGDVIKDLLRNAGLPEAKVNEFGAYVAARGKKGVQAQKVLQYIDALQAEKGNSPQDALRKFGVDLGDTRGKLGEGGYGEVHAVKYRGEDYVYKLPTGTAPKIGDLTLVDDKGKALKPDPVVLKNSYVELSDEEPLVPLKPGPQRYLPENSIDFGEYGYKGHDEDSDSDSDRNSVDHQKAAALHMGYNIPKGPPPKALIVEESSIEAQDVNPLPVAAEGQKLARTGLANAARVKDLPQVITPSVFVVKEGRKDGSEVYHAVAGQKTLKDWAKVQNKGSSFEVVGLLMPKAAGKNPLSYSSKGDDEIVKVNVSRSDLKPMAQSALTLLKGMAQHGFIHGDIKPENLIWDASAKKLQLIDNDSLVKVSKKAGSVVPKGLSAMTPAYLNPLVAHKEYRDKKTGQPSNSQLGLGRDLYATGLVLLEASLLAGGGDASKTQGIMDALTHQREPLGKVLYFFGTKPIQERIKYLKDLNFEAHSVQDFARTCLIKALEFEQDRIDRKDFGFDRSPNGKEAALIRELEDQLEQVS